MKSLCSWQGQRARLIGWAFLFLCFTVPSFAIQGCDKLGNLTDFKYRMEEKVRGLRDGFVAQYKNICGKAIQQCSIKSYDLCDGTGIRQCLPSFPTPSQCISQGIWLSKTSGVRISNAMSKTKLSDNARKFICASAHMQPVFQQLTVNNYLQYSFAYIGSSSGAIRVSPGFKQERNITANQCSHYDPRKRPWYVSAITGAKTTIILFDISRTMTSMHPGVRFLNAKVTLEIIFQTLNSFDYVGVVVFSSSARTITFNQIQSASEDNKNKILKQIQGLSTELGATNYTAAIEMGMRMLQNVATKCQNTAQTVFLLLTDGYTENDQPDSVGQFQSLIETKLAHLGKSVDNFKLISFVYGMEQNIDYTIVKQLTCIYKGIVFRMWDGIDEFTMVQKLTSYYVFLSEGINEQDIKPLWSDFYLDGFGFGMIVTVTIPIYVSGAVNKIIGVAGIDILLSKFEQCGYDLKFIEDSLKHKPSCFKSTLSPSELLYLRCQQGNIVCTNASCSDLQPTLEQNCSASISNNVFYDNVLDPSDDDQKCCTLSVRKLLAIVLSGGLSIIVSIVVFFLYWKGYIHKLRQKCRRKPKTKSESEDSSKVSLLHDHNLLIDPQKKYKQAEQNGIRIYREPQFSF